LRIFSTAPPPFAAPPPRTDDRDDDREMMDVREMDRSRSGRKVGQSLRDVARGFA
jgi:hypothetical protein